MKYLYLLTAVILILQTTAYSQAAFTNRNDLLRERDLHSGVPVAIADMNGDGLDDIVTLDNGTDLYIQYQTPDPKRPFVRYKLPVVLDIDTQNDICIGDFNNDGVNDIFAAGFYDRLKILYGIPYTYDYALNYIPVVPFFSQGASTGDFNGDGWLDVVILNDNGLNYTMMNDQAGNLVLEDYINFHTVPVSDNSGNYGSVYTDFDMDGDVDFFIAKCRQGVNNPADPRRINALYVNDGNNNYVENAAAYGLADGSQSWTADFGDIDNDGDLDLFVTQHDIVSELFENINNDTFINITTAAGLNIGGIPLQGMFRDFDNDGFQDILVSGDRIDYYHNNGDKTFTKYDPFSFIIFGTFALGDLNHDGFTDIYASCVIPFNNPDELDEDILWLNEKNDNHFLALNLINTEGNPSAIGSAAFLYGPWGIQVREVRGGEQYGVSNGHTMIFGLGEAISYDSLVIRWPDGFTERYNELAIDQTWNVTRGGCTHLLTVVWPMTDYICGEDSLVLAFDSEYPIRWSTGETSDSIVVKTDGLYYLTYEDANGCEIKTHAVEVVSDPDTLEPVIFYEGSTVLCNGESLLLTLSEGLSYTWSNGDTSKSLLVTSSGDYSAVLHGFCNTLPTDTISIEFITPDDPVTVADTFKEGESVVLMATGDSIVWYDESGGQVLGTGPVLTLDGLTETTTVFAQNVGTLAGEDLQVGPIQQAGTSKYNANFINGGLLFDVMSPIVLNSLTVYTDSVGTRIIEISDGQGFFYEHLVYADSGATLVEMNVPLLPGNYTITTNTDQNGIEFGLTSPLLWRSDVGVDFPYVVEDVIRIRTSTFGEGFYYYFYDWKISTAERYCVSDLVPVIALFDPGVHTNDPADGQVMKISPNPTSAILDIEFTAGKEVYLEMVNLDGTTMPARIINEVEGKIMLDVSSVPDGMYIIHLRTEGKVISKKVIKL